MQEVKVGDVVAWDKVPSGALVSDDSGDFAVRLGRYGEWVALHRLEDWCAFTPQSAWHEMGENGLATLIALGLTGQETAADLQWLAEVFEVREAWLSLICALTTGRMTQAEAEWHNGGRDIDVFAPRLHAAGWRPGMTAEDAARLLAEKC